MNELKIDRFGMPGFGARTADRKQAARLHAFKQAVRNGDIKWIVADYPADRACTLKDCVAHLLTRLQGRIGKTFTAD